MSDLRHSYPSGFAAFIEFGDNGEPIIKLVFYEGEESMAVTLTTQETQVMLSTCGETLMRCAVITEMTTMFPEQRDSILENLRFRWSGGEGLEDGSADQGT